MSQADDQQLAPESGEIDNDDAVMAALMAKGEAAEQPGSEAGEDDEAEGAEASDDAVQDDDAAAAADETDEELTFELDGKPVTLKKSQLPEVYRNQLLEADYRRKTAEAAEAKRAAQELAQRAQQERSHYASQLDTSLALMHKQLIGDQEALVELARTDPAEWVAQNAAFQQRVALYQDAMAQREQLTHAQQADQQREVAEWRKAEREKLQEKLPEWRDTAKASAEQRLIAETLMQVGYSTEELTELFDHRALIVARKAALYDQLQAAKAKQAKPEPPKALKPGAAKAPTDSQRTAYQDALAKAKRTGRPEDVERALMLKGT